MNKTIYEIHPLAACWPKPENFEDIMTSIKEQGQLDPITLYEGKILDGVQRYRICGLYGIETRFETPEITDPLAYVLAKNKHRRHATKGQIAMAVAKMAKLPRGGNGSNQYEQKSKCDVTSHLQNVNQLAKAAGISTKEIGRAKHIHAKGSPEVIEAVQTGKICADIGSRIAKLPKEAQAEAVQKAKTKKPPKMKTIETDSDKTTTVNGQKIRLKEFFASNDKSNTAAPVREWMGGFYLVNLCLIKKEIVFLNRALNSESSENEYEMAAKCLIKSLRERGYQLSHLNQVH
jgi:hypothetical protein